MLFKFNRIPAGGTPPAELFPIEETLPADGGDAPQVSV
jgi:hypothetical protein